MRFIVTQEEKLKERRASDEHIADNVQQQCSRCIKQSSARTTQPLRAGRS